MRNRIFCVFLVDFHSARLFFAIYGAFCGFFVIFLGSGWGGDELGSILSFCTLCVFAFFGQKLVQKLVSDAFLVNIG